MKITVNLDKPKTIKKSLEIIGGLTQTEKMPGFSYSLPAQECKTGSKLRKIKNSVCSTCYALKGNYIRYPNISESQYRRLNKLNNPLWVYSMVFILKHSKKIQDLKLFRWHDSGDIQSLDHFKKIIKVCESTPEIKHWLPTKESKIIKNYKGEIPKNLVIRLSGSMIDGSKPNYKNTSTVSTNIENVTCGASLVKNGKCGNCRKCWDSNIKNVCYYNH